MTAIRNLHPALKSAPELCKLPAVELRALIAGRAVSVAEVASAFLQQVENTNPAHNAIVSLRLREEILAEARKADEADPALRQSQPLFGLPMAVKDLALTKGLKTTFGSPIFADFIPDEDEIPVRRLREAGALFIGKTNTPEFGLGSQTYNPVFGATRNAYDANLIAGGSSGGAAVALALGMVPVADGSDMGGSLRNPAGYNNIYGLRPSQGLVPQTKEDEKFFSQLAATGPMARTVDDLALLLSVQAGFEVGQPLMLEGTGEKFRANLASDVTGQRIGWLGDFGGSLPFEPGIFDLCHATLARLSAAGCKVDEVPSPFDAEELWRAFVALRHFLTGNGLRPFYEDARQRALLKPEAIWEIEGAIRQKAEEVYWATRVRTKWFAVLAELFERFDFLALPSAQVFPFSVGEHWPKEINGKAMDSYHRWMQVVIPGTLSGCPVISLPAGFDARGRAMGLQVIGKPRSDLALLRLAHAYEQATGSLVS